MEGINIESIKVSPNSLTRVLGVGSIRLIEKIKGKKVSFLVG